MKFNPDNKDVLTYGDCLDPIFKITDKDVAMQYKRDYIAFIEKNMDGSEKMTAEQIANVNIGYYAGYSSNDDRKRIETLFECSHPIFGSVAENVVPKGSEALECGKQGKTLSEIRNPQ